MTCTTFWDCRRARFFLGSARALACSLRCWGRKVRDGGGTIATPRGACAPQIPSPQSSPPGRGGREAPGKGNRSRTIDLDLLYCGSERRDDAMLQLPHPRMTERKFVLQPLCDIAPDLRLPGQTKSVGELLAQLPDPAKITRLTDKW